MVGRAFSRDAPGWAHVRGSGCDAAQFRSIACEQPIQTPRKLSFWAIGRAGLGKVPQDAAILAIGSQDEASGVP